MIINKTAVSYLESAMPELMKEQELEQSIENCLEFIEGNYTEVVARASQNMAKLQEKIVNDSPFNAVKNAMCNNVYHTLAASTTNQ